MCMSKPLPPDEHSARKYIERAWIPIQQMVLDAAPIDPNLRNIEHYLRNQRDAISDGVLSDGYDWALDLHLAMTVHRFNLDWVPTGSSYRESHIAYWKDQTNRVYDFTTKISLGAFNTMILLHGAVALGALNVLSQKSGDLNAAMAPPAKWAIFGALLGILLLALGQVIMVHKLNEIANTVVGRLIYQYKFRKLRAIGRYWNMKYKSSARYGEYLVHASIFWFFAYCSVAFLLLP
jgi:hypothetical protein